MKRILLLVCLAIASSLTVLAYDYVDSLTYYVFQKAEPIYDLYGDLAYPNEHYHKCAQNAATHIAKVGYSGDTTVLALCALQEPNELRKIERYTKDARGNLRRDGKQVYYDHNVICCSETYEDGFRIEAEQYAPDSKIIRRYLLATQKIKQRTDMYPDGIHVRKIELYDYDYTECHYYTKDGKELPFTLPCPIEGSEDMSEHLSKELYVPSKYLMNSYSYLLKGIVSAEGKLKEYTIKGNGTIITRAGEQNVKEELDSLAIPLLEKYIPNQWQPGVVGGEPEEMLLVMPIHFTPLYYAKNGDTLYCEKKVSEIKSKSGDVYVSICDMFIRNKPDMPYYAVADRVNNNVTLRYYKVADDKCTLIENYTIYGPNIVMQTGYKDYETIDGIMRYYYDMNVLKNVESYDSIGALRKKYTLDLPGNGIFPTLTSMETYYPSGKLLSRTTVAHKRNDADQTTYYDENGNVARYLPSADAEKVITSSFKKRFKLPAINDTRVNHIKEIYLSFPLRLSIDEKGIITNMELLSEVHWQHLYNPSFLSENDLKELRELCYNPYANNFLIEMTDEVLQGKVKCSPATINGKPVKSTQLSAPTLVLTPKYSSKATSATVLFDVVEEMPEFPGGKEAMTRYLSENVKYPIIAQEKGIQGRVICQFKVDVDGTVTNVLVLRSGGDVSLDNEAVRIINSMPKWKPGKHKGKLVPVRIVVPINFQL